MKNQLLIGELVSRIVSLPERDLQDLMDYLDTKLPYAPDWVEDLWQRYEDDGLSGDD